jgi:hypothetical protein
MGTHIRLYSLHGQLISYTNYVADTFAFIFSLKEKGSLELQLVICNIMIRKIRKFKDIISFGDSFGFEQLAITQVQNRSNLLLQLKTL